MPDHRPYRKWYMARRDAGRRGIPFLLSFRAWLAIWKESGHWHERGLKKGQYVMARHGDVGPYEIGNVKIITQAENTIEGTKGKKWTVEQRANLSKRRMGRVHSPETIAKMRESNLKTYSNLSVRKKAGDGHRGWSERRKAKLEMLRGIPV